MKLLSLFSGSGGFELAGAMCGITPVACSEIEPYPIAVTRSRFPNMKHLGDISKINGENIEPVDIITFGSPCQDMSVAGKRAGLKHEDNGDEETTRSGLFMEAVRIIKEMRGATNGRYPRFAVWENVPGAFSSNKGEDFRLVLEELIKVAEPNAVMPEVPKKGWAYADSFSGDGWSLAYRVFDAQYWGVPQRRRRIYLVADFRGQCARQILFERQSLRGYFTESGTQRQRTTADVERSVGADDRERENAVAYSAGFCPEASAKTRGIGYEEETSPTLRAGVVPACLSLEPGIAAREGGHIYEGVSGTLRANAGDNQMAVAYSVENHPNDSRVKIDSEGKVQALASRMGTGGGNVPMVMEPCYCLQGNGIDRADTAGCNGKGWNDKSCYTLNTIDRPAVAYEQPIAVDRAFFNQGQNAKYEPQTYEDGTNPTLVAKGPSAVCYGFDGYNQALTGDKSISLRCKADNEHQPCVLMNWDGTQTAGTLTANNANGSQRMPDKENFNCVIHAKPRYIVRRLTPTECARLQGFPDRWGDIDKKSDFTDEEYRFWLEVRNTHAAINGRQTKNYTEKQMLSWYNKLHTDSAEYKLWGNGIALPCALYVMEGIVEAMKG